MAKRDRSELALKLWVVLARAYGAVQAQAQAHATTHGFTLPEFGILEALYHKGPLLLGDLQRKILVSSGGITYLVDRLEAKGLVERQACPDDRRARYAALTDSGQTLMQNIFPEHATVIEQVLEGLNDREKRDALTLLRTLGHHAATLSL